METDNLTLEMENHPVYLKPIIIFYNEIWEMSRLGEFWECMKSLYYLLR